MQQIILLLIILVITSCASPRYHLASPGEIPAIMPNWDIRQSPFYQDLVRNYGSGIHYERAKIRYLLGHTQLSAYSFDRNGYVYSSGLTAKHLRKKYKQQMITISTAQEFIDRIASFSSASGRAYLALPGDGKVYRTRDILNYELDRVEQFMHQSYDSANRFK